MKKNITKLFVAMLFCGVMFAPSLSARADSYVRFTEFNFTTVPYSESFVKVVSKPKNDSEANWYVTFTYVNTGAPSQNPAIVSSAQSATAAVNERPAPVQVGSYKTAYTNTNNMTGGQVFSLYASGNANNGNSYSITMSGRYTS